THVRNQAGPCVLIDASVLRAAQAAKDAMLMVMAGNRKVQSALVATLFDAIGKNHCSGILRY
ncbi:MAG: hypothetical protein P8M25_01075, partial [Paracoccaceae bacterium]|nr:hypothetical protein [Paracoccaceae bacterium]